MSNFETFLDLDINLNINDSSNLNKKSDIQETLEGIDLKSFYTKKDTDNLSHIGSMPGIDPFVRGPYPTMYANKPYINLGWAAPVIHTNIFDSIKNKGSK